MFRTYQQDLRSVDRLMEEPETVPQLKLFRGNDPLEVENEVNEWLRETEAQVMSLNQSLCEHGGRVLFIVSVFYR